MRGECLNCEEKECYECWLIGDSKEAKKAYSEYLDKEIKRVFG